MPEDLADVYHLPCHVVPAHDPNVMALQDAEGRTMFVGSAQAAHMSEVAINAYTRLVASEALLTNTLLDIYRMAKAEPASPLTRNIIAMADYALADDDEGLEVDLP